MQWVSAGGAVLSKCHDPEAKHPKLAMACSRYLKCHPIGLSLEDCVRLNLYAKKIAAALPDGEVRDVRMAAIAGIMGNVDCVATAKSCADLAECTHWFAANKCANKQATGCDGAVAWGCFGQTKPLAVACTTYGMNCLKVDGKAACVRPAVCTGVGNTTCVKNQAMLCSKDVNGNLVGLVSDCDEVAATCVTGSSTLSAACKPPIQKCSASFKGTCLPGAARNCVAGAIRKTPCGVARTCLFESGLQQLVKTCSVGQNCTKTHCSEGGSCTMTSRCQGNTAMYCEGGWPVTFACTKVGMKCVQTQVGARCQ